MKNYLQKEIYTDGINSETGMKNCSAIIKSISAMGLLEI